MIRSLLIIVMLVMVLAGRAEAGSGHIDFGGEFLSFCGENKISQGREMWCAGYLEGIPHGKNLGTFIADAEKLGEDEALEEFDTNRERKCSFWTPPGVNRRQIRLIFLKYLRDHPEKLHFATSRLFYDALMEIFPCQKK